MEPFTSAYNNKQKRKKEKKTKKVGQKKSMADKEPKEEAALYEWQITRMPIFWFAQPLPFAITRVCDQFPIYWIKNFIEKDDCEWIIKHGQDALGPSTTVEGDSLVVTQSRTSRTAQLTEDGVENKRPALFSIQMKCAALSHYPLTHLESINLTHYDKGQYFGTHHDYFQPEASARTMGKAGQRICTFFVYLNDVPREHGGKTIFPNLNLSFQPQQGSALFWLNTAFDGSACHPQTLHEGERISEGTKWGLNVWIRQNAYL
jgi:prolyl 4-hydroxylase